MPVHELRVSVPMIALAIAIPIALLVASGLVALIAIGIAENPTGH